MRIALLSGPHRRYRHQVRQVECRDDGLPHVGVGIAWNRGQPRVHGIERFRDRDEATPLDHPLNPAQFFVGDRRIGIEHRHRGRDMTEGDLITAQLRKYSVTPY